MPEAALAPEPEKPPGVSELPLAAECRDCSLVGTREPNGDDDHPHAEATGHEVGVAGLGDLPWDRELALDGGGA